MNSATSTASVPTRLLPLLLIILLFTARPSAGASATIEVNTTADIVSPGDGSCTLREAITNANTNSDTTLGDCAAGSGFDTITFVDLGTSPDIYTLTPGDVEISDDLVIAGLGQDETIIEAAPIPAARVFRVTSPGADGVTFSHLSIRGGNTPNNGGGILNLGGLVIVLNSAIYDNVASHGGGIVNEAGMVTIDHSILRNNTAGNQGGAIFSTGFGTVNIRYSTVRQNSASSGGGGIFNEDGTLELVASTVSGNMADSGGGILNGALLEASNSTVSGNNAVNGGGLFHVAFLAGSTIDNSTFSQNSATGLGGGIYSEADLRLAQTIVADNVSGLDCAGSMLPTSADYNLDSDNSCNLVQPNDLPAGIAALGPLQNNGGPTETHALMDNSEAIDWIDSAICPPPSTDQRGFARPFDGDNDGTDQCDIGAFEVTIFFNYLPIILFGSQ